MEREKIITLVQQAQTGDTEAMESLFSACYNDVYYFAVKTVKDPDIACDVTQETFLKIVRSIGELKEPAAFPAWIRQIAYRECMRYFSKNKEVQAEEDEDGNTVFDTLADESEGVMPEEVLEKEDFQKTILDIIDRLSEEQRSAVMMYYFDEFSVSQIAGIQGVSEGTVKSRLNYARKSIKNSVEDYEKKHGIRLHSIALLPLLLLYFGKEVMPVAKAAAIHTAVMTSAGGAAATVATGSAATAATTGTATATSAGTTAASGGFWSAVTTKVVAGVAAAGLLTGGAFLAFGGDKNAEVPKESEPTEVVAVMDTSDPTKNNLFPQGLLAAKQGDRWGYINKKGEWVIQPAYETAYKFAYNGLAPVQTEGKFGYINTAGEMVIAPAYENAWIFRPNGLAKVMVDGKWGCINEQGEMVIQPVYDEIDLYQQTKETVEEMNSYGGVYHDKLQAIQDMDYEEFYSHDAESLIVVKKLGRWGYINTKGETVVEPIYQEIGYFAENGLALMERYSWHGYVNKQGEEVISNTLLRAGNFGDNGLAWAVPHIFSGFNFINENQEIVFEVGFDGAGEFSSVGLAAVKSGDKWGYINGKGEWAIEPAFTDADKFDTNGLAAVKNDANQWGYINTKGEFVVKPIYDHACNFYGNGFSRVKLNGKWGYVNEQGQEVVAPAFDVATPFYYDGYAAVAVDGKWGVINEAGEWIIEPSFDNISS